LLPEEIEHLSSYSGVFTQSDLSRGLNVILANMQQFKRTPIPQLPLELTVMELIAMHGNV
ncbi:MAG: hypothetical protein G01um101429_1128, partial [Parcubacteria group bacterium Gr01-1014_29]